MKRVSRYIEIVDEGDGEHRVEFRLADNNENYSLREYTSTSFEDFWVNDNRDSIYIKDYDPGQFIEIDDGYIRFNITDKNFLDYVSVEKDNVNNLTKLSINNGTGEF